MPPLGYKKRDVKTHGKFKKNPLASLIIPELPNQNQCKFLSGKYPYTLCTQDIAQGSYYEAHYKKCHTTNHKHAKDMKYNSWKPVRTLWVS